MRTLTPASLNVLACAWAASSVAAMAHGEYTGQHFATEAFLGFDVLHIVSYTCQLLLGEEGLGDHSVAKRLVGKYGPRQWCSNLPHWQCVVVVQVCLRGDQVYMMFVKLAIPVARALGEPLSKLWWGIVYHRLLAFIPVVKPR